MQLEVGMKRREMQRHFRPEMLENPLSEFARFRGIVVERGDHQVGDLEPDVGLVLEPLERFEHGLEMRQRDFSVEIFREGFQIHVGGVNVVVDVVKRVVGDVAVGDHHGVQPVLFRRRANVNDVLAPNGRLVVGERQRRTAVLDGQQDDIFRRHVRGVDLVGARLGNIPVLAEEAAHVAAGGAHGKNLCARQEMVQRLLLDGINLNGGGRGVSQAVEFSALIDADEAEAGLTLSNVAVPRAEIAMDFAGGCGLPPTAFVERLRLLEDVQFLHGSGLFSMIHPLGKGGDW